MKTKTKTMLKKLIKLVTGIVPIMLGLLLSTTVYSQQVKDTTEPSDVDNLIAVASDSKVTLSWDAATDNVGVSGYKIYYGTESVIEDAGKYNLGFIQVGNVLTYEVTGLKNGTTYYFGLTALDQDKNESVNYSFEVKATPAPSPDAQGDTTAPRVKGAESRGNTSVKIIFSEEVVLPKTAAESAFQIEDNATGKALAIITAQLDAQDQKNVLLTTEPQTVDREYLITVGIGVEDKVGNPIVSGVSDSAVFQAKTSSEPPVSEPTPTDQDTKSPELTSAVALSVNSVKVIFSEEVVLGIDPTKNFLLYEKNAPENKAEIKEASLDLADKRVVTLATETLMGGSTYELEAVEVTDVAGNQIKSEQNKTSFEAITGTITDIVPPEDVANFIGKVADLVVHLTWNASLNSAGDLIDQILYISKNKGQSYDSNRSLGPTATSYDVSGLEPGKEYTFKLTVKDKSGNESQGTTTSVTLPETGPGIVVLVLASLVAGTLLRRKKSHKKAE